MTITTDHPASSYGRPVVVHDDGAVLDQVPGLRAVLGRLGWTQAVLAERTGFSLRAVQGWFRLTGRNTPFRPVPAEALNVMGDALRQAAAADTTLAN